MNIFQTLRKRGFIYQTTDDKLISDKLDSKSIHFYAGFDPTADSLHLGHLLPIMFIRHLQSVGHIPIILVGGATALIGDPSGKQEARPILSKEKVAENAAQIKTQLARFIDIEKAIFVNNTDWFKDFLLIDFLRDIGHRFSVNRMLASESVRQRLETGISYLEFSYALFQAYDFFYLNKNFNCELQIGGQDQWGNIVAGIDLVRRMSANEVFGITAPLLLNSQGQKFGKTEAGTVWLDEKRTSLFDYYQFWRNTSDDDVKKLLLLFTMLPIDEAERLGSLDPPEINRAKEILAFEATTLAYGTESAEKIFLSASSQFEQADPEGKIQTSSRIVNLKKKSEDALPVLRLRSANFANSGTVWIVKLMVDCGLCSSNSEARRLISGGGAYLNDKKISNHDLQLSLDDFPGGTAIIKAGKKNLRKILID